MSSDDPRTPWTAPVLRGTSPHGLDQAFDEGALYQLRSAVAAYATALGADGSTCDDLLIIAGELANNAIRWGGGRGRLRLWRDGQTVLCRVSGAGPRLADLDQAGRQAPPVAAVGGRGLWLVRQISDRVDIDAGPNYTAVTAAVHLDPPGSRQDQ